MKIGVSRHHSTIECPIIRGRKDYAQAARHYSDALQLSEANAFDWSMVAHCHEKAGNSDKALEAAERALELDAEAFWALQTAARISAKRGDYQTAKLYIERGFSCVPDLSGRFVRFLQMFTRMLDRARFGRERGEWLEDHENGVNAWKTWAIKYLEWYRGQFEGSDHKYFH